MAITRAWRVYGMEDHRQRESFNDSRMYDFSVGDVTRIVEELNEDITGTNDYTIIRITADTPEEAEEELWAQISDGIFENCRTGKTEEIKATIVTRDREAGNIIAEFDTIEEAQEALKEYEETDKADGVYSEDFYEIGVKEVEA